VRRLRTSPRNKQTHSNKQKVSNITHLISEKYWDEVFPKPFEEAQAKFELVRKSKKSENKRD
jgi:hypothetical protein